MTSLALSHDGRALVYETWDSTSSVRLARVTLSLDAPRQCLPAEVVVKSGGVEYVYQVSDSRRLVVPVGRVDVEPRYKYLGDVRCKPVENLSLRHWRFG